MAPIITFQVNICKRAGSHYGFNGIWRRAQDHVYIGNATDGVEKHPEGMAAPGIITAEWANTVL